MKPMEIINYILHKLDQIAEPSILKWIVTGIISLGFFLFGELWWAAITGVVMLMVFDTILGIAASVHEGREISSARFSRALLKGIVYLTTISAGYFADQTIPMDFIQGTMIAFVGVTEFISILENVGRMGYDTPKKLLNNLKEYKNSK